MRHLIAFLLVATSACQCGGQTPTEGEGEATEGEGEATEGEGEPAEGEGEPAEGEGEASEGEGEPTEGEGEPNEGEGEPAEGEGEPFCRDAVPGAACTRSADCAAGDRCQPFVAADAIIFACAAPCGPGAAGEFCNDDDDCQSNLCSGTRTCSAPCVDNSDCATNQSCANVRVTRGAVERIVSGCSAQAFAQQPCSTDVDCAARGQTCSEVDTIAGVLTLVCGNPPSGQTPLGGSCSGDTGIDNPLQCASGLCDDEANGQCIGPCDVDADCGVGLVCTAPVFSNLAGKWCASPCTSASACGYSEQDLDSRLCRRRCDDDGQFDLVCGPALGTRSTGAMLAAGEDASVCRSGFSVSRNGVSVCSLMCSVDADCPDDMECAHSSTRRCGDATTGGTDPATYCRLR
jgi:hypothetical protein